jgi:P4 family phage/plasmid primase-like protien
MYKFEESINFLKKNRCSYFTGNLSEIIDKNGNVKKYCKLPCYSNISVSTADNHVNKEDNSLILMTGSVSNYIVLIDWDLYKYNVETKDFELNECVMKKKIEIESKFVIDTYVETTANNGYHWIYRYNPEKCGIIANTTGFTIDGIKCGDIKGEGGICYLAPSSFKSVDGQYTKEYSVVNNVEIKDLPDDMYNIFNFSYKNRLIQKHDKQEARCVELTKEDNNVQYEDDKDILEVSKYLECILDVDDYNTWMNVCFSCSSEPKYYKLVHEWARKSSKYEFDSTKKMLHGGNGTKTIGSLYYMAKKQNPVRYKELFEQNEFNVYFKEMIIRFNHFNCANYFYMMNKYNYSFDEESCKWYKLEKSNIWSEYSSVPGCLKLEIINLLTIKLNEYIKSQRIIRDKTIDEKEQKLISDRIKEINLEIANIGKMTFISGVISLLSALYISNKVKNRLNQNRHLLAFDNCVFDLNEKKFRDIEIEDYINITTGYSYLHEKVDMTKVDEVIKFLKSISNDEIDETKKVKYVSDYQFLLNIISSTLYGENRCQKFYIFSGNGGNGKSLISKLNNRTLGNYFKDINVEFFTRANKDAGSANPELVDKQSCRMLLSSEPESNEKIQASKLKKVSGGDLIQVRGLYEKVSNFLPHFTCILLTNSIPDLSKIDGGVVRRLDVVEFKYKFVDNPMSINERKKDVTLDNKISNDDEFRDAFMWLLIENYKVLNFNNFKRSESSDKITKEYIEDNNPVLEYINEYCVINKDHNVRTSILFNDYNEKALSRITIKKFNELMRYIGFEKIHVKCGNCWVGLSLKNNVNTDILKVEDGIDE